MESTLQSYFVALGGALKDGKDVETVKQILRHALQVLNFGRLPSTDTLPRSLDTLQPLAESLSKSAHLMSRKDRFKAVFRPPRGTWVDSLLSIVAGDWWEELTQEEREGLFEPFLMDAPLMICLFALEGYLSIAHSNILPGGGVALEMLERILRGMAQGGLTEFWEELLCGGVDENKELEGLVSMLAGLPDVVAQANGVDKGGSQDQVALCLTESLLMSLGNKMVMLEAENDGVGVEKDLEIAVAFLVRLFEKLVRRGYLESVAGALMKEGHRGLVVKGEVIVRAIFSALGSREKVLLTILKKMCVPNVWPDSSALPLLLHLIGPSTDNASHDRSKEESLNSYQLLQVRLLSKNSLPYPAICWIVKVINARSRQLLEECAASFSQLWADSSLMLTTGVAHQACMTAVLAVMLEELLEARFDINHHQKLMGLVLEGISNRLDNPSAAINYQGMRVAEILGKMQDRKTPVFKDIGINFEILQPEEEWPGAYLRSVMNSEADDVKTVVDVDSNTVLHITKASDDAQGSNQVIDSDDDSSYVSSEDDLQPLDLSETEDKVIMAGDRPATLLDMLNGLRKTNEPKAVLTALKQLPVLLESLPDELDATTLDLARSVIFAPVPDWSDDEEDVVPKFCEEQGPTQGMEKYRFSCMVSLLLASPFKGGEALIGEVYASNLTIVDRLGIMSALGKASKQLSLGGRDVLGDGSLSSPAHAIGAKGDLKAVIEGASVGKSRVWGVRALEKKRAGPQRVIRNLFVDVALVWTAAILKECDRVKHAVDLFGKQHAVLGKLLVTLGIFAQSASQTSVSAQLAVAILELVSSPGIHQHPQPSVRRSALSAAFQVLCGLPPARLAHTPLEGWKGTAGDSMLTDKLEWLAKFTVDAAASDPDETCRLLASGCVEKQARVAAEAMHIMANTVDWESGRGNHVKYRLPF